VGRKIIDVERKQQRRKRAALLYALVRVNGIRTGPAIHNQVVILRV
jgi:hypothetical protein